MFCIACAAFAQLGMSVAGPQKNYAKHILSIAQSTLTHQEPPGPESPLLHWAASMMVKAALRQEEEDPLHAEVHDEGLDQTQPAQVLRCCKL